MAGKIKLIAGLVVVMLIVTAGAIWLLKNEKNQKEENNSENHVEFVKEAVSTGAEIYNGTEIAFDSDLMSTVNNWNSNVMTYKSNFFITKQNAGEVARRFGITSSNLVDAQEGWKIGNNTEEIEFITTDRTPDGYAVWLRYRDWAGEKQSIEFMSDDAAMKKVQEFTNNTIIPTLEHASKNLTFTYKQVGVDSVFSHGNEYIIAKVFDVALSYDSVQLSWKYSMRVNATGEVIWVDGPADFQLLPDIIVYIGTPTDILNFYKENGMEVDNASDIECIVIYGLKLLYGPFPTSTGIKFTPFYSIDYRVIHTSGSDETHRDYLDIKGVSAP